MQLWLFVHIFLFWHLFPGLLPFLFPKHKLPEQSHSGQGFSSITFKTLFFFLSNVDLGMRHWEMLGFGEWVAFSTLFWLNFPERL